MKRLVPRPTYANVVSTICLFLLLGGATAFAAGLGRASVGTKQLKRGAVTSAKVKDGSLQEKDLKAGTVLGKAQADARYLGGTLTVIAEIGEVSAGGFAGKAVQCPAGFQAIGGGVSAVNVNNGVVAESSPMYGEKSALLESAGQHGSATGWFGEIKSVGLALSKGSKVTVICSPIG